MFQQYMNQAEASLHILSPDELKELLNDDDKLEDRVNEVLLNLESEKEVALNSNRILAEENLAKEPDLIERRSRVNDLSEQGKALCASVQEKLSEVKSKSNQTSPDSALALLQAASAESEEDSENIVKQLLDKEITIEIFLTQFIASRKTMHLRKLKSEKMAELIKQKSRNSAYGAINSGFYPPPVSSYGSPSGAPYPMGPIHMPMPGQFRHF